MNYSKYRISLDIHDTNSQAMLNVKKDDNARKIFFSLTDGGRPYKIAEGCTAIFRAKKPDGTILYNNCTINDNVIEYTLTSQTSASVGIVECEVTLYGSDSRQITSPRFVFVVEDNLYSDSEIESQNEFTALTKAIAKAEAMSIAATEAFIDMLPETAEASENDIQVNILFDDYENNVIRVRPNPNRKASPLTCGRQYLLDKNTSMHSSIAVGNGICLPIAVIDPDTGDLVSGETTHYNPYFVPMNFMGEMSLYIKSGVAIWLNPPFYYCIDADPYLGKNLTPYDDVDWKCKITRGNGWASIQGVCKISGTLNPSVAGERDIIKVGLPFRPHGHKVINGCCADFSSLSTSIKNWEVGIDKTDGSVWVRKGTAVKGPATFTIDLMYPVMRIDQSLIEVSNT